MEQHDVLRPRMCRTELRHLDKARTEAEGRLDPCGDLWRRLLLLRADGNLLNVMMDRLNVDDPRRDLLRLSVRLAGLLEMADRVDGGGGGISCGWRDNGDRRWRCLDEKGRAGVAGSRVDRHR